MKGRLLQLFCWVFLIYTVLLKDCGSESTDVDQSSEGRLAGMASKNSQQMNRGNDISREMAITSSYERMESTEAEEVNMLAAKMTPEELDLILKLSAVFQTYLYIAIGLAAVMANSVSLIVLFRQKQHLSPYTYMTAIAVCDLLSDRLIAVRLPLKRKTWCSIKNARITCCSVITLSILISLLTLFRIRMSWLWDEERGINMVVLTYTSFGKNIHTNNLARALAFIFRFLVPFSSMFITNTLTLHSMHRAHKFRKAAMASKYQSADDKVASTHCVTITIGVVVAFFITQTPRAAYYVDSMFHGNANRGTFIFELFVMCNEVLAWVNTVVNFFIYAAFSKTFSQEIQEIFPCCKAISRKKEAESNTTSSVTIGLSKPAAQSVSMTE